MRACVRARAWCVSVHACERAPQPPTASGGVCPSADPPRTILASSRHRELITRVLFACPDRLISIPNLERVTLMRARNPPIACVDPSCVSCCASPCSRHRLPLRSIPLLAGMPGMQHLCQRGLPGRSDRLADGTLCTMLGRSETLEAGERDVDDSELGSLLRACAHSAAVLCRTAA